MVFVFITADLARSRRWIFRREEDGYTRSFVTWTPDTVAAKKNEIVDAVVVNPAVTPEWCRRMVMVAERGETNALKSDPVVRALVGQYNLFAAQRRGAIVSIDPTDISRSYLLRKLAYGTPFDGTAGPKLNPYLAPMKLTSFEQDADFVASLARIRASGVPFAFVHLPTLSEIEAGHKLFGTFAGAAQEEALWNSLIELGRRPIIEVLPYIDRPNGALIDYTVGGREYDDAHPSASFLRHIGEAVARAVLADSTANTVLRGMKSP